MRFSRWCMTPRARSLATLAAAACAPRPASAAGYVGAPPRGLGGCSLAAVFLDADAPDPAKPEKIYYLPFDVRVGRTEAGAPQVRAITFEDPATHEQVVFATVLLELTTTIARFACAARTYPAAVREPLPVLSASFAFSPSIRGLSSAVQGDGGGVDLMFPRKWVSTQLSGAALRYSLERELLSTVPSLSGNVRWRVQDRDGSELTLTTPLLLSQQDHHAILRSILEAL
ncbi:hypothetical protein [Sorangium sp. So ce542]|uniref:hypothetical protein n=1 Tax=Sorangium sp. So ce542 TaxID=3133316 RepID=UPI003F63733B